MGKARTLLAAALLLASVAACEADTLISTNFTTGTAPGWVLNGRSRFRDVSTVDASRPQALSLTQNGGDQTGVIWTEMKYRVPSFSFIADVLIRHPGTSCPADGFAMVFGNIDDPKTVGGGGGAMGLFGGAIEQFTAFEINTWRGQGLGDDDERLDCKVGKHVTFAFDVVNAGTDSTRSDGINGDPEAGGAKIGQVLPPAGMTIVGGGWFRYQWNVAQDGTMSVYVTGLNDSNKQFQKVKVLETKIAAALGAIDFEGRFGMTAATGGAFQHTDIAAARVDAPMIEPQ